MTITTKFMDLDKKYKSEQDWASHTKGIFMNMLSFRYIKQKIIYGEYYEYKR